MTDLAAARSTERMLSPFDMQHECPLATSAVVYEGGGVAVDTDGKIVRASAATAVKSLGRACSTNAAAAAGDMMKAESGIFRFANGSAALTDADRLQPCYWEDDQTVGGNSAGLLAGIVYDVDSAGVWVMFPPAGASGSSGRSNKLIAGGAAYTVLPEDDGATVQTATDNAVVTLPNAGQDNKGEIIRVQCTAAAGAAKVSVSPHSSDKIYGGINGGASGNLVTFGAVLDKDIILTKATALLADFVLLQSNGVDGWNVIGGCGIWASEA